MLKGLEILRNGAIGLAKSEVMTSIIRIPKGPVQRNLWAKHKSALMGWKKIFSLFIFLKQLGPSFIEASQWIVLHFTTVQDFT